MTRLPTQPPPVAKTTVLFRSVRRNVRAGSYAIKVHLNATQLKRLPGKNKTVKIFISVYMLVPAKGITGTVPILTIKALTLKSP